MNQEIDRGSTPGLSRCGKCGWLMPVDAPASQCQSCLLAMASLLMDPSDAASPGFKSLDRRFGDYILGPQLGSGGMGVVYAARHISLNRDVALKFIRDWQVASPALFVRFRIEAEAAARLHHPNIVSIHEIGEIDGQPYFSMDLVEGKSLRSLLDEGHFAGELQKAGRSRARAIQVRIAQLIAKTARAVHHAHQAGVLHRDLKPANVLLNGEGDPILTDFGLAKILYETTAHTSSQKLPGSGEMAGTPSYMSPEQVCNGETSAAADVYGLGAMLYELLVGVPPFTGNSVVEIFKKVQYDPPKDPRKLNTLIEKDFATICLKCLEKDPRRRFTSAEALATDLENWASHKPITARRAGVVVRTRLWIRRNPAGTALIAALFVGFSIALVLLAEANRQKRKFEIQQSWLFDQKVQELHRRWRDASTRRIVISAGELAILDNRMPLEQPAALQLSLGDTLVDDGIISYAQEHASAFANLEQSLSELLRQPVQLNLTVFKADEGGVGWTNADFMLMDALSYVRFTRTLYGTAPVARIDDEKTAVMMTRSGSGITNLAGTAGHTMLFPDANAAITIFAKARLCQAGVHGHELANIKYSEVLINSASKQRAQSRAIAAAVLKGEIDVGCTVERRFRQEKHSGLVALDTFAITSTVLAARPGVADEIVAAFRSALARLKQADSHHSEHENSSDWGVHVTRSVPIDDHYFDFLRKALATATEFDLKP
jgi:hypothetical protein